MDGHILGEKTELASEGASVFEVLYVFYTESKKLADVFCVTQLKWRTVTFHLLYRLDTISFA